MGRQNDYTTSFENYQLKITIFLQNDYNYITKANSFNYTQRTYQ